MGALQNNNIRFDVLSICISSWKSNKEIMECKSQSIDTIERNLTSLLVDIFCLILAVLVNCGILLMTVITGGMLDVGTFDQCR
jgi:hypothetical protein